MEEVTVVARSTGTVGAVESLAQRIRLSADTVDRVRGLGALQTGAATPPGTEHVSGLGVVGHQGHGDAAAASQGVPSVAAQAVSVGVVEGLAQGISLGADSILEVGTGGALGAHLAVPLGAQNVSRSRVVLGLWGDHTVAVVEVVAGIAAQASSIGTVEGLAQGVGLSTDPIAQVSTLGTLDAHAILPPSTEQIAGAGGIGNDTVARLEEVAIVAAQASSVVVVEGLAEGIGSNTDAVGEIGRLGTLHTDGSVPLGAQFVGGLGSGGGGRHEALALGQVVAGVAGKTGSGGVVISLALRVDLDADALSEDRTDGTLLADGSDPLGAELISRGRVVLGLWGSGTVAVVEVVTGVARGTGTIGTVEGLAQWVDLGADSVAEVSRGRTLLADSSLPSGAEEVAGSCVVGDEWYEHALASLDAVSDVTAEAVAAVLVSGLTVRVVLGTFSVL